MREKDGTSQGVKASKNISRVIDYHDQNLSKYYLSQKETSKRNSRDLGFGGWGGGEVKSVKPRVLT